MLSKNFFMWWTSWLFWKICPSLKPNHMQSVTNLFGVILLVTKEMNVRRSCSTQLLLCEICKCKSGLLDCEQLSSSTNTSSRTVISSKWSYPSGVHSKFLTFLHFSFINHCPNWISLNLFYSNVCYLYTVRINELTVALFR